MALGRSLAGPCASLLVSWRAGGLSMHFPLTIVCVPAGHGHPWDSTIVLSTVLCSSLSGLILILALHPPMASLLPLQDTRKTPTSGPLHVLFFCPQHSASWFPLPSPLGFDSSSVSSFWAPPKHCTPCSFDFLFNCNTEV